MIAYDEELLRDRLKPVVDHGVLVALQTTQELFTFIPDAAVDVIANLCNVSRAEVHGVRTYYSDFRNAPTAAHIIKVCVAESCQALGSRDVVEDLKASGYDLHQRNAINNIECEQVFCLGNCALGPAAMVNGKVLGRVTAHGLLNAAAEFTS